MSFDHCWQVHINACPTAFVHSTLPKWFLTNSQAQTRQSQIFWHALLTAKLYYGSVQYAMWRHRKSIVCCRNVTSTTEYCVLQKCDVIKRAWCVAKMCRHQPSLVCCRNVTSSTEPGVLHKCDVINRAWCIAEMWRHQPSLVCCRNVTSSTEHGVLQKCDVINRAWCVAEMWRH